MTFCSDVDLASHQYFEEYVSTMSNMSDLQVVNWQHQGNWDPRGTSVKEAASEIRNWYFDAMAKSHPWKYFSACRANYVLWLSLPPLILLIGTVGNLLSFIVLRHPSMSQISSYVYLATLAVVDELVLLSGLLRNWLNKLNVTSTDSSAIACKFFEAIGTASTWLSAWLIIALTVERVIVITFPLHANRLASPSRAKIVILTLTGVFIVANLHYIETVGLTVKIKPDWNITTEVCNWKDRYMGFGRVWSFIDAALYSYIPLLLISVMNTVILVQVYKARKSRRMLFNSQHSSMRTTAPCIKVVSNSFASSSSGAAHTSHNNAVSRSSETGRQLTIMLVVISFCFLITTSPIVIVKVLSHFLNIHQFAPSKRAPIELTNTIGMLLMYMNHSMNFFLYCATGNKFRQQLKRLLCRNRRGTETVVNHSGQYNSNFQARLHARRSTGTSALNSCDEAVEMRNLLPSNLSPNRQNP